MSHDGTAPVIPTRYKSALAKGTSYPCGAQAISAALQSAPQFEMLSISFRSHFPPSKLREQGPLPFIQFSYQQRPPTLSSSKEDRWGMQGSKWEITVYPILGTQRKIVKDHMGRVGFSMALAWLINSWEYHGRDGKASMSFILDQLTCEISTQYDCDVLPAR